MWVKSVNRNIFNLKIVDENVTNVQIYCRSGVPVHFLKIIYQWHNHQGAGGQLPQGAKFFYAHLFFLSVGRFEHIQQLVHISISYVILLYFNSFFFLFSICVIKFKICYINIIIHKISNNNICLLQYYEHVTINIRDVLYIYYVNCIIPSFTN